MKVVFQLIAYLMVFLLLIKVNTEDRMIMLGEVRSYGASIVAAHDAAVVLEHRRAEGFIVFDEMQGRDNFESSLRSNLGLNVDLSPINKSIFSDNIKIVALFFIGDDKVPHDANGSPVYPYELVEYVKYRGETITLNETLHGPSVVAMIEAPLNVQGNPVKMKSAVYRYIDKEL